jgi:hypothetical protein
MNFIQKYHDNHGSFNKNQWKIREVRGPMYKQIPWNFLKFLLEDPGTSWKFYWKILEVPMITSMKFLEVSPFLGSRGKMETTTTTESTSHPKTKQVSKKSVKPVISLDLTDE